LNTKLDTTKSRGFKSLNLYCVAPIVNGDTKLATYDFWAVGKNWTQQVVNGKIGIQPFQREIQLCFRGYS
jgi:hypothetical protein